MLQIILLLIIGAIFWTAVFKTRSKLMRWVEDSNNKQVQGNDRVRELAWWAAIGVICVFLCVADMLAKAAIALL